MAKKEAEQEVKQEIKQEVKQEVKKEAKKESISKENLSFEDTMQELEDVLAKISAEGTSLNKSVELYARAAELLKRSNEALNIAQIRVDEIDKNLLEMGNE